MCTIAFDHSQLRDVQELTAINTHIFPEYLLPYLRRALDDPDVSVRLAYAQCLPDLAETALRFLELGEVCFPLAVSSLVGPYWTLDMCRHSAVMTLTSAIKRSTPSWDRSADLLALLCTRFHDGCRLISCGLCCKNTPSPC